MDSGAGGIVDRRTSQIFMRACVQSGKMDMVAGDGSRGFRLRDATSAMIDLKAENRGNLRCFMQLEKQG